MTTPLFRWHDGRQDADYSVLTFLRLRIGWPHAASGIDAHIIRYVGPTALPEHRDVVEGCRHYRLNVVFGSKGLAGADATIFNWRGRVILFRSDQPHSMALRDGQRYVLSFGLAF